MEKYDLNLTRFWNADRMSLITFYSTPFVSLSPSPAIRSLAFSSDGNQIVVGFENGYIEIYPTVLKPHDEGGRVQPVHKITDRSDRIQSISFSPNDKYLAIGCIDGSFDIYDVKNKYQNLRFKK